jgi:hypothetical protein
MGEILEKGLLIGFGLSVSIFFISIITPFISLLFTETQTPLDQHDTFVFTMDYGLAYNPQEMTEELHINMSLSIEITLTMESSKGNLFLNITSPLKSTRLYCSRLIILSNHTITGEIETIFTYNTELIILTFRGRE